MLYNAREKKSFNDYFSMISEAKYAWFHGIGLKILTHEQMFQRLPIAIAQVKAGNTSEILQNKMIQIIYSLYPARGTTKKYITI